jgi:hypothetical protein
MANQKMADPLEALTSGAMYGGMQTWMSTLAEYQSEIFDFMSQRCAKNADLVREMSGCRNFEDASFCQTKWLEETMRDYSTESAKVLALCTRNAADIAQKRRPRA